MEIQKLEYLENEKTFLDEIKTFFIVFEGLSFSEKYNFDKKQKTQALSRKFTFFITYQSKEALKQIEYAVSCIPFSLVEGNYYLVNFEGEPWLGQLIKLTKSGAIVKCLQKAAVVGSIWRWPEKPNEEEYVLGDICQEIETPLRSSNLSVHVCELDYLYKQTSCKICSKYYSCLHWFMIYQFLIICFRILFKKCSIFKVHFNYLMPKDFGSHLYFVQFPYTFFEEFKVNESFKF